MRFLKFKQQVLLAAFGLCTWGAHAQQQVQCGATAAHKQVIANHPELKIQIENVDKFLNNIDPSQLEKNRAGKYIIPIVIHVIHNYGAENISDDQIKGAINILNVDYQKRNPDTALIVPAFQPIIANVGLEFRLATIDPDGNCTDGIDRIASYKTYRGNDESKLNPWPRNRYLNVWTMHTLQNTSAAAYAYKPATAQFMPQYDGVLAWHQYIGNSGTSNSISDGTLTHEIGHCLNLDHPWGATNDPEVSCGDDNVTDTPPTEGHLSCTPTALYYDTICTSPTGNVVGPLENLQNFMDYSYCANEMFTLGQKDRMLTALLSTVAQRSELITATTHTLTGTLDGQVSDCNPVADFNAVRRFACVGSAQSANTNVIFKDFSHKNTITGRSWNFNTGNPATSTSASVTVTYDTPGWKEVQLTANSNAKSGTKSVPNYLYISDPNDKNVINQMNMFEDPNDYARWPIFNYFNNAYTWKYYDAGNTPTGWRALMFDGFDSRPYPQNSTLTPFMDIDDIITPSYNTTGLSTGYVSFKLAAATLAGNITQIDDSLIVSYSLNCGNTWTNLGFLTGTSLINNGYHANPYFPTPTSNWKTVSFALDASSKNQQNVYFRIRHRGGTYSNNLFIDNFLVGSSPVAVENIDNQQINMAVVPNPASDKADIVIKTAQDEKLQIVVTDLIGKVIYTSSTTTQANISQQISLPSYIFNVKGMYQVTIGNNAVKQAQKLIVQ